MSAPRTVRCLFRVLSVTEDWEGRFLVKLGHAQAKQPGAPPEASFFEELTPSGKAELRYKGACPLRIGAYYFLDIMPHALDSSAPWTLSSIEDYGTSRHFKFYAQPWPKEGFQKGDLEIGVTNELAWDAPGVPHEWRYELVLTEAGAEVLPEYPCVDTSGSL